MDFQFTGRRTEGTERGIKRATLVAVVRLYSFLGKR